MGGCPPPTPPWMGPTPFERHFDPLVTSPPFLPLAIITVGWGPPWGAGDGTGLQPGAVQQRRPVGQPAAVRRAAHERVDEAGVGAERRAAQSGAAAGGVRRGGDEGAAGDADLRHRRRPQQRLRAVQERPGQPRRQLCRRAGRARHAGGTCTGRRVQMHRHTGVGCIHAHACTHPEGSYARTPAPLPRRPWSIPAPPRPPV